MYPYNRTPQMQPNQMQRNQLQTQEIRKKASGDKKILELLELAMIQTAQVAGTYQSLIPMLQNTEDRTLLQKSYLESIKHLRLLQDVIYQLGGKNTPLPKIPKIDLKEPLEKELRKSFQTALEDSTFFRNLFFNLPQGELRDTLMELFTDKQKQAMELQFLWQMVNGK